MALHSAMKGKLISVIGDEVSVENSLISSKFSVIYIFKLFQF